MADSLSEKLSKVKDEHAAEEIERRAASFQDGARNQAFFVLGRIKQTGHLAGAIYSNLAAQEIRALEHFQKEKWFIPLGFNTFDEFLTNSEFSPMTKRQYYDRLALVRQHGDEIYDLLTSIGISVRAQKLLGTGDLAIKGDALVVGDREIEIKDAGLVKDVLNELFDEKRELQTEVEKKERRIEKLAAENRVGRAENEQLQRNLEAMNEQSPFERALMHALHSMLRLVEWAGTLPDDEKAKRGADDLQLFAVQYFRLSDAYGVNVSLRDEKAIAAAAGSPEERDAVMERIMQQAIDEGDDLE